MQKEIEGYTVFIGALKFNYLNETADSFWNIKIYDLSKGEKEPINLFMDSIPLVPGQNLVDYKVKYNPDFIDKHFYLFQIENSRNEI